MSILIRPSTDANKVICTESVVMNIHTDILTIIPQSLATVSVMVKLMENTIWPINMRYNMAISMTQKIIMSVIMLSTSFSPCLNTKIIIIMTVKPNPSTAFTSKKLMTTHVKFHTRLTSMVTSICSRKSPNICTLSCSDDM